MYVGAFVRAFGERACVQVCVTCMGVYAWPVTCTVACTLDTRGGGEGERKRARERENAGGERASQRYRCLGLLDGDIPRGSADIRGNLSEVTCVCACVRE